VKKHNSNVLNKKKVDDDGSLTKRLYHETNFKQAMT